MSEFFTDPNQLSSSQSDLEIPFEKMMIIENEENPKDLEENELVKLHQKMMNCHQDYMTHAMNYNLLLCTKLMEDDLQIKFSENPVYIKEFYQLKCKHILYNEEMIEDYLTTRLEVIYENQENILILTYYYVPDTEDKSHEVLLNDISIENRIQFENLMTRILDSFNKDAFY